MKILRAQSGERLFKGIEIRVFFPGNKRSVRQVHRAPAGRGLNERGVDLILEQTAAKVERSWPKEEYGMVQLSPSSFNFVWRATRAASEEAGEA
jgi:hypothetical protein